jgi:hypothetical protein
LVSLRQRASTRWRIAELKLERATLKVLFRRKVRGRYPPEVGFFVFPLFNHLLPNLSRGPELIWSRAFKRTHGFLWAK